MKGVSMDEVEFGLHAESVKLESVAARLKEQVSAMLSSSREDSTQMAAEALALVAQLEEISVNLSGLASRWHLGAP